MRILSKLHIFLRRISLFVWVSFSTAAQATDPVHLKQSADFYVPLTKYLEVYVDHQGDMTFDEIISRKDNFTPVTTKYPDFGLTSGRVWLRTTLINDEQQSAVWRLNLNRQYYSEMNVFKSSGNGEYVQVHRSSNANSFNDREIPDRMLATDLVLSPNKSTEIYISYRSDSTSYLPVGIGSPEGTSSLRTKEHTLNWVVNGALLAIIVFTLMMTPVIGWRIALSFAAYIFIGFVYVFHADGYTFQYIWPNQKMSINDPLNLSFMSLMPAFGMLFSRAMFNFKKNAPRFDKFLIAFIVIAVLGAATSSVAYQFQTLKVIAYLIPPVGTIIQITAGIIAIRCKLSGSVPYFIGAAIVVSSFAYALIAHTVPGQYNLDMTLDYGHFALFAECLAFAAAIVIRLSGIRRERDRALQAELVSAQDKLQLKSALQKSQDNYIQARKMSDLRKDQLTSVSHDLQQPLASLRVALSKLSGADEESIKQMYTAFDYLETLARDQITAGNTGTITAHMDGAFETFPIRTILDNVYEMFKSEAAEKNTKFHYAPVDANITSDPIALMRAISNLVSNAIKHTENGVVSLSAHLGANEVQLEISDTGVGFDVGELETFKKRFEKGENSKGHGLGLAIVSDISKTLNLGFEISSRPGEGTKAVLLAPLSH